MYFLTYGFEIYFVTYFISNQNDNKVMNFIKKNMRRK